MKYGINILAKLAWQLIHGKVEKYNVTQRSSYFDTLIADEVINTKAFWELDLLYWCIFPLSYYQKSWRMSRKLNYKAIRIMIYTSRTCKFKTRVVAWRTGRYWVTHVAMVDMQMVTTRSLWMYRFYLQSYTLMIKYIFIYRFKFTKCISWLQTTEVCNVTIILIVFLFLEKWSKLKRALFYYNFWAKLANFTVAT